MNTSLIQRTFIAALCAPALLLADTPTSSTNPNPAAKADNKSDSQSSNANNGESVSKEVRSVNGAKVTIERTKDASGHETITMRTPKGNGRDRVKVITEKEYQRLFGNPPKAPK